MRHFSPIVVLTAVTMAWLAAGRTRASSQGASHAAEAIASPIDSVGR